MSADQPQAVFGEGLAAELKGDDGRVVAGHVVAPTGFGMPGLALVECLVASGLQGLGKAGGGMEGVGRP